MSERGLPDGYVACDLCSWAGPKTRYILHRVGRHGILMGQLEDSSKVNEEYKDSPPRGTTIRKVKINKTEQRYYDMYLKWKDARYEALTFHMSNGARYTPDFVVFEAGRPVECIEVKGSYRLGSHNRAQLAFAQCRIEFAGLRWTWATWDKARKQFVVKEER